MVLVNLCVQGHTAVAIIKEWKCIYPASDRMQCSNNKKFLVKQKSNFDLHTLSNGQMEHSHKIKQVLHLLICNIYAFVQKYV